MDRPTPRRKVQELHLRLRMGVPLLFVGPAATVGAVWYGLDYIGALLLGFGIILTLVGAFIVLTGGASTVAQVEMAWKRRAKTRRE